LFATIGIHQREQLPIAYYRYQTHDTQNKNAKKGGGGYCTKTASKIILCADPIHLEVGLNDITLTQHIDDLTDEDAKQCIDALNQYFKQDGLEFIYGSQSQWYLILQSENVPETTPLLEVLRKNIAHFYPASKNMNWEVIQNEVQMILHMLPLNQKRENAGLATLNSLWFYGGGEPKNSFKTLDSIYSNNEEKGRVLSNAAECKWFPLPKDASNLLKMTSGKTIVMLDQLMLPTIYDDVQAYQKQLSHLDDYIKPIMQAWKKDKIEIIIDSCTGNLLKPIKIPRWQFWPKHSPSLTEIAQ